MARKRIIALYEQEEQTSETPERTGYCPAAIRRVKPRLWERGTLEPLAGPEGKRSDEVSARLRGLVEARPDTTLAELREALAAKVVASTSTVDWWLGKLGLTFRKVGGQSLPDVAERRRQWAVWAALDAVTDDDCRGYFRNCGYAATESRETL